MKLPPPIVVISPELDAQGIENFMDQALAAGYLVVVADAESISILQPPVARKALMDGITEVAFHGWTDHPRCAVGDGSAIYIEKEAVVELPDGVLTTVGVNQLKFVNQ